MKLTTILEELLPLFRLQSTDQKQLRFPTEHRLITSGFEVWRLDPGQANELFGVKPEKVRIEFVKVAQFGKPHIHKFARASFLFLGETSGYPNPHKANLLLGEWGQDQTSYLQRYSIHEGLLTTIEPMLVHGFEPASTPIFFLAAHTPLIHENGDMYDVQYEIRNTTPKQIISVL